MPKKNNSNSVSNYFNGISNTLLNEDAKNFENQYINNNLNNSNIIKNENININLNS